MSKEGYVYLGELYDVMGRTMDINDKKIGLSINPVSRENQLNRTKSPVGYRVVTVYKVDDMNKVEKMLHSILDSRRTHGEWFKDDEDTLTGEFINFMNAYGGEYFDIQEEKQNIITEVDTRLSDLASTLEGELTLIINSLMERREEAVRTICRNSQLKKRENDLKTKKDG
jgi:hypothetical protein